MPALKAKIRSKRQKRGASALLPFQEVNMKTYIVSYAAVHRFKLLIDAPDEETAIREAKSSTGDALWTGVALEGFRAEEAEYHDD
jgi:hypothetical protein